MKIIKLDAIDSTNSFLKNLAANSVVEDLTVVVAKHQTLGRGQMNSDWLVEGGKNLTFSVFTRFGDVLVSAQKYLSYCVALSVYQTVNALGLDRLSIKWPNDIMAGNKKIAGILIENTFKSNTIDSSVIGVGLNVNQDFFSDDLPNASSLKILLNKEFDLDLILNDVLKNLKKNLEHFNNNDFLYLETQYLNVLYKKNVPTMFKNSQNILFMGKIIGVSTSGKLQIELIDETIQEFGLKEVSFANL
ncbi:MAG: biotin--[acetyl-CoA-carboxylase] ligase [Tenacibaculum sp.]